jgi:exodeoxyribonuclease V alpha subunit
MPMSFGPPMLLTRNLLYTAVTRAKKLVVIVGQEKYLKNMIDNNLISKRYSGLLPKLRKVLKFMVEES